MRFINNRSIKISLFILFTLLILNLFLMLSSNSGLATESPDASLNTISGQDSIQTETGSQVDYYLNLRNNGAQGETFILEVTPDIWDVSIDPEKIVNLGSGNEERIKVTFNVPRNPAEGEYEFYIDIKSLSEPAGGTIVHAIVSSQEVIITAVVKPVLIIQPFETQLGRVSPGEKIEVDIEVKCYVTSADVYLNYDFLAFDGRDFIPEKNLEISVSPNNQNIKKGNSEVFTVTIEFPENFDKRVDNIVRLQVTPESSGYDAISKPVTLRFLVRNDPEDNFLIGVIKNPLAIVTISSLIILGSIGVALTSHEAGKYWLLSMLFIPLYTKLHKNKILDHFTRGRVYEFIRNNPGTYYSEIKRELELNNGSLTYHLHTLEREELVKSRTSGRFKVFYPTDVKIPKDMEPQISSIRRQILDIIREEPGITQKELGFRLPNKKQRTISYHVKNMAREGVLDLKKDGRETKCYIAEKVMDIKRSDQTEDKYSDEEITTEVVFRQI